MLHVKMECLHSEGNVFVCSVQCAISYIKVFALIRSSMYARIIESINCLNHGSVLTIKVTECIISNQNPYSTLHPC